MQLLTIKDVAQRLKVARQTVYKILSRDPGFPRPTHLGRAVRWRASDVDQ